MNAPLKDGKHKIWKCEQFKKLTIPERYEKVKQLKLCFSCLAGNHRIKDCKARACGVYGCQKRHNRLLHTEQKKENEAKGDKKTAAKDEATAAWCSLKASGILPVVPVTVINGDVKTMTLALCDSGASLSFIDETFRNLKLKGHFWIKFMVTLYSANLKFKVMLAVASKRREIHSKLSGLRSYKTGI